MKTFILEWNPEISSYRIEDFENDLHYIEYGEFNWSVWDWRSARSGDNFYMIRCSGERNGIVMKGFFTSDPYEADDWSGKGREVHYMDFRPVVMVHPETGRMLGVEALEAAMPDFLWNGGHSGRELPEGYVGILNGMWDEYLAAGPVGVNGDSSAVNDTPAAGIDDAVSAAAEYLFDRKDGLGNPLVLHSLAVGLRGKTDDDMVCGFLHSVMQEGGVTAGELRERGFSERIVDALMVLRPEEDESVYDFVRRVAASGDSLALSVIRRDIPDWMSRIPKEQQPEYMEACRYLGSL